jgi:hypothetical protein
MRRAAGTRSNGGKFRTTAFKVQANHVIRTNDLVEWKWVELTVDSQKRNLKRSKQELPF